MKLYLGVSALIFQSSLALAVDFWFWADLEAALRLGVPLLHFNKTEPARSYLFGVDGTLPLSSRYFEFGMGLFMLQRKYTVQPMISGLR